jgi:hypothetical protein
MSNFTGLNIFTVIRIHCNLHRRALCQKSSSSGGTCCLHCGLWHVSSPVTLQYSITIQYSTLKKVSSSYETTQQPTLNTIPIKPSSKFSSISFLQGVTDNECSKGQSVSSEPNFQHFWTWPSRIFFKFGSSHVSLQIVKNLNFQIFMNCTFQVTVNWKQQKLSFFGSFAVKKKLLL